MVPKYGGEAGYLMFFGIKRNASDAVFSDYIREKADWKCEYKGCFKDFSENHKGLECSHFITRGNKSVRWDEENAAAFCTYHHMVMGKNPGEHYLFFEERLGKAGLDKLMARSRLTFKERHLDEKLLRTAFKILLKRLRDKKKSEILGAR